MRADVQHQVHLWRFIYIYIYVCVDPYIDISIYRVEPSPPPPLDTGVCMYTQGSLINRVVVLITCLYKRNQCMDTLYRYRQHSFSANAC